MAFQAPGRNPFQAAFLAVAVILAGCGNADQYQAALRALSLPSSWELVNEYAVSATAFCMNCPRAFQYYVASEDLPTVLEQATGAVRAAGYLDVTVSNPKCDLNSNDALCSIAARSDSILLLVAVYPPGFDVDQLGLSEPGKATVRFEALSS
jgi:hypothetical protein